MLSRDIVEIQTTSRQKPTLALTLHPWRTRRLCAITEHSFAKVNLALLERAVSAPLPGLLALTPMSLRRAFARNLQFVTAVQ